MPDLKYFILQKYDDKILNYLKTRNNFFQLIDKKAIVSEVQVGEAIRKTERYIQHNDNIHFPGNVLLMYLSGTRQIDIAINKCGISKETERGIIVYSNKSDLEFLIREKYIEITERFLPYDIPEKDFEVFSNMAKVDVIL
ncbi:KEOPS complex subunit Cgi121 [Ferroplasma sp.]|uniref:KEOPS complex subunit Cgi121 n=1 Tax=Ferroplasma sp. TaxID=2591003 RepID=UPI00307F786E